MLIHLVTYATRKFRHRQLLLSASAKANKVVSTTKLWTSSSLKCSSFTSLCPDISLSERGSGFWSWKPFIILQILERVPDGDVVVYSDVGRKYPYILLENTIDDFVKWMNSKNQDVMPGVRIPWNGPMSMWTKRDALIAMSMDRSEIHEATPIQASFSIWRNTPETREFVKEWQSLCLKRDLVSDDVSAINTLEHPNFIAHRHDQSLLTLCCIKHGIQGIEIGRGEPKYNERDLGILTAKLFNTQSQRTIIGSLIYVSARGIQCVEKGIRHFFKFGKFYDEN